MSIKSNKIQLADGRSLGYAEYGDPNGIPVLYFHGTPNSRLNRHPDETIPQKLGIRIINVERPGYGLSDSKPGRKLLEWPEDVSQLADALKVDKFAAAGVSGGGPYVLACTYKIPNRITSAVVISGFAPLKAAPNITEGMSGVNKAAFWIGKNMPFLLPYLLGSMARAAQRDLEGFIEKTMKNFAKPDQEIAEQPEIKAMFMEDIQEAYRQGAIGHVDDIKAVSDSWGFNLKEIPIKVHLWHGERDINVPPAMGRYLADTIPNCKARFLEDEGHFVMFTHWNEILQDLIA